MGYVNVTDISTFIPPSMIQKTLGTWTPTISSNLISDVRTAADASFALLVPLVLPGSDIGLQGAKIKGVDLWYKIATNAADDFATVEVSVVTLADQGDACAGTTVDITIDTAHDAAAERKAIEDHKMEITLDDPVFIEEGKAYYLNCLVDAHANTAFSLFGALVHYELRL